MMFFKAAISLSFFFFLFFLASNASSQKRTYIIHTDKTKSKYTHTSLLSALHSDNVHESSPPEIHYIYESAISGFSATLTDTQLETLKNTQGFVSAYEDELLALHTTHSPKFLGLEFGVGLWNITSLASDVIIGLVDTGITPEHVSFRDTHMPPVPSRWKGMCEKGTNFSSLSCNKKIIGARAFYRGYEAIVGRINETVDFRSARDAQGHGTHTASTAAGEIVPKASFLGLAKGLYAAGMRFSSRIAAYKVCWELGCASSDVLAAIDRATADGVNVISLSLGGSSRPFYADPIAIGAFGAMEKNVFVSCSAGNSGPLRSSVSNGAPWAMTVAATYTDRTFPSIVEIGNGQKFVGSSLYKGKKIKNLAIAFNQTAGGARAEFCVRNSLKRELVEGKIVICLRGASGRTDKGEEVKRNRGAAMLLVNEETEGEELLADAHVLPASSLGASAGNSILKYLATSSSNAATASIRFKGTAYGATAPIVAAFSSRGPSITEPNILKPDISAPGMNILAGWTPFSSPSLILSDPRRVQFNVISGTSMSCPHISGIAALIIAIHGDWSPAMVKSALITTARITDNRNRPIQDMGVEPLSPATAFALGAGHVDPTRAADPGLVYDIPPTDYLNYLCSLNYTAQRIALFAGMNYTCPEGAVLSSGDLNYPSFAVNFDAGHRNGVKHTRTVTNVGLPTCEYVVNVKEPRGVKVRVKPQILRFEKSQKRLSYSVTFVPEASGRSSSSSSFGSLVWICGKYRVRSPIAVTWQ